MRPIQQRVRFAPTTTHRSRQPTTVAWLLALVTGPAAAVAPADLGPCINIADDTERLACYDLQVGRAASAALPASPAATLPADPPEPVTQSSKPPEATALTPSTSFLSRYWELDPADKRGTFNYTGYNPNYFMPLHLMRRVNQTPYSPSHGTVTTLPDYQHGESKLQISLRTKIARNLLLPGGDLWVGYTQQSLWQVWNHSESAPFRNTDYQPEVMYVAPTPELLRTPVLGWSWRMTQVGLLHQSNGQPGALSRSWNRAYALVGVETGDVSATLRLEHRLGKEGQNDDNPDIVHYLGKAQVRVGWTPGLSTALIAWRPSLDGRGSVQMDWTYPIDRHKPDGLRAYVQLFHGYGETILDYNFRQTSLGLGLSIFKF